MTSEPEAADSVPQPKWRQLTKWQRRVVGVLVEKAKTTPDAYPLTLNALTVGCNQKNNRAPITNLSTDDVEQTLQQLRDMGAVVEVQGSGRVAKYRHQMYEWLGVDKVELAVMAELLLRGEQTVGELRSRASRMEPIPGLAELQPILQSLIAKNLVISLTSPGRGQIVTHGLLAPRELEELRTRVATMAPAAEPAGDEADSTAGSPASRPRIAPEAIATLQAELTTLRDELAQLRTRLEKLEGLMQ